MRYDLKTPCKNCPFRNDATRIRFRTRKRAAEIEEQAYRHGFPCHLSAELVEDEDDLGGPHGYMQTEASQHCIGYVIMRIKEGCGAWPGIGNDEDLAESLSQRVDLSAPVFDNSDDFLSANEEEEV